MSAGIQIAAEQHARASLPASPTPLRRAVRALRRYELAIVTAVALMPVGAFFLRLLEGGPRASGGDGALLEMQTRDVGRVLVWLGPYSRFGFAHPGPILFYLYAIPYWLTGGHPVGLQLAALLINTGAIVAIAWLAYRRGGMLLAGAALLLVEFFVAQAGISVEILRSPWNPDVTILPFLACMFLAWELACGTRWAIPVVVFVASFLIQTHLGYAPVVLAVTLTAGACAWKAFRRTRGTPEGRRLRRTLGWSAALIGALWVLPLAEQSTRIMGNFTHIVGFSIRHPGDHSIGDGVALMARYIANPLTTWFASSISGDGTVSGTALLAIPVLLLAGISVGIAARRSAWSSVRFAALVLVALVVAASSVSRIVDDVEVYLVRWMEIPALLVWLVPVVVASDPKVRTTRRLPYAGTAAVITTLMMVLAITNTVRAVQAPRAVGFEEARVIALDTIVRSAASEAGTRSVIVVEGPSSTNMLEWGVGMELYRRGYRVRYPRNYAQDVREAHVISGNPLGLRVMFAADADRARALERPGARPVGSADGITVFVVATPGS